jgi:hypothetical protein
MADATNNTPNTPTLSRNLVYLLLGLVAILAIAAIVVIAISKRHSPWKIYVQNGEQRIGFEFEQDVNLSDMLDSLLSKKGENSPDLDTQKRLIKSVLENNKFYLIPSKAAANEIRSMRDTDKAKEAREFVEAIRSTLYDLDGPFSQPNTLLGIKDNRLLNAFEDLNEKDPQSPLLQAVWEWNLEGRSFLKLRIIENASVKVDPSLAEGIAKTCAGSVLLGKTAVITSAEMGASFATVSIDKSMLCPNSVGTSAQDLLKGKGTLVHISPKDMQQMRGEVVQAGSVVATLVPFPKNLTNACGVQ